MGSPVVRPPAVAGLFYPAAPARLAAEVDELFAAGESGGFPPLARPPIALVAPHAGYRYSGAVAARGLRELAPDEATRRRIFLLGPSHHAAFTGVAAWDGDAFRTPLGDVPVDREAVHELTEQAGDLVTVMNGVHVEEHAIEVLLPFLQRRLKAFTLVPMIMGRQDARTALRVGEALSQIARPEAGDVFVASSDLSHYHPYAEAVELDRLTLERIAAFDPEGLLAGLGRHNLEACGGGPMASVLAAARGRGGREAHVLAYRNSGDVTGDLERVVGYAACAVTG
jgi:MEMO1 family protein